MSASTTPTFWPEAASAAARFTVTDDLPTPPLPLATAYTRVSEDGWENGICGSGRPPRSWVCSARRCSSLITSSSTRTLDTPGTLPTAAVTSRVMVSRSGQPATVSQTSTSTTPSGAMPMFLTMPSSVIGRWISGSCAGRSWCHGTHVLVRPMMPNGLAARPGTTAAATVGTVAAARRVVYLAAHDLTRGRVEDDRPEIRPDAEVEQAAPCVQAARDPVEGAASDPPSAEPVVLDELGDRDGVGQVAADVVLPRPGRDHDHGQPLAEAAAGGPAVERGRHRGAERGVR